MFFKILRVIIIFILVYYIAAFIFNPLLNLLPKNTYITIYGELIISIIETALTFFIAQKFLVLRAGEAKQITLIIMILSLVVGTAAIIYNQYAFNEFNRISGDQIFQGTPIWMSIVLELIQAAAIYYFGNLILKKSEI